MEDIEIALWSWIAVFIHLHCDPVFSYKSNHYFFCWKHVSLRIWNQCERAELGLHIKMQMNFGYLTLQLWWYWLNKRVFSIANYSKCTFCVRLTWQVDFVGNFGKVAKDIWGLWQWKPGNHLHFGRGVQEHLPLRTARELLAESYSLKPKAMAKITYTKRCFWDMFGCFLLLGYCFTVKREIVVWSCVFYAMQLQ